MDEKISIIVAVYNIENYIGRCIQSLLKQSYTNIEVLLIDDGSDDSSGEICREYAEKDERIKYFYKENGGLSDARNYGIAKASGSWITFVDGDDFVYGDMYQVLAGGVFESGLKIGMCSFQTFYHEAELDLKKAEAGTDRILKRQEVLELLLSPDRTDAIISCCKLFHKELFQGFQFPTGRYREDEFSTYKFWFKVEQVYYTERKMYFYYQREGSILHQRNVKKETDYWDALLERHLFFEKKELSGDFLCRDAEFCAMQLYNALFLENCSKEIKDEYIRLYKQQYDTCGMRTFGRYFAARYFTPLFLMVWKIRKRTKSLI